MNLRPLPYGLKLSTAGRNTAECWLAVFVLTAVAHGGLSGAPAASDTVLDIGNRRQVFIDGTFLAFQVFYLDQRLDMTSQEDQYLRWDYPILQ